MDIFAELLFASFFLLLLALVLASLGVVGLAVRWVLQVWRGGGSHRPYDMDVARPSGPSGERASRRADEIEDGHGRP